jgi:hypothetical protein
VNLFLRHRWATWLVLEPEHFPPMLWAFPLPCSDVTGPWRHLKNGHDRTEGAILLGWRFWIQLIGQPYANTTMIA